MNALWIWLIPLLPLAGTLLNGWLHARVLRRRAAGDTQAAAPEKAAAWIGSLAVAAAFLVSLIAFFRLLALDEHARVLTGSLGTWIEAGPLTVSWTLTFDPLSAVMALVVTGVGALIHVYSIGYMRGDPGFARYFAYLNLFIAAMLILVLSSSLPGLFLGWEGVGLCSYLLIGFWYDQGEKADAARKAFIVNRIGDFGFLIGMFLLFWGGMGTLELAGINANVTGPNPISPGIATLAGLCLFLGCCGKSAQIPLHIWLPDAMAGPTPVSALIHAATMVTAGVYLVARLAPFFAFAPGVLPVIACVGALTALVAATIGLAQKDIKKVLAYSTVSQLGYMFLGLGVGAFSVAIFHLVAHAFFKALLFLCSGSVIHAMHDEQNMFRMGGLRDKLPVTYKTMLIGSFALAGVPLFSGFFSKDEILFRAVTGPTAPLVLWIVGTLGALLTALYIGRLISLTFLGTPRYDTAKVTPHESPAVMTRPLVALAFLAVAGSLLGLPHILEPLEHWLAPVTEQASRAVRGAGEAGAGLEVLLMLVGAAVALGGLAYGIRLYRSGDLSRGRALAEKRPQLHQALENAWYFDLAYHLFVVLPLKVVAFVALLFDQGVIDGLVNRAASLSRAAGARVRRIQSGGTGDYAFWLGAGATLFLVLLYLGASR